MNKKILGILLCGMIIISLTGCGNGDSKNDDNTKDTNITENSTGSIIDASMDSKNPEYNQIKKTAIVLNRTKNDNGYYEESEILYDASGTTVVGVHVKQISPDYEDLALRKSNAEETLKKNGWEYYDVKIVDNHIELEYVSTNVKTIASNGFIDPLDVEKQLNEAMGYKYTVTDNSQ
ncbi:MAG: hypothetical protein ACI31R_04730 [Bacilli bacterium]